MPRRSKDSSVKRLNVLAETIVSCQKCERLRDYCEFIGRRKRRAYADWDYWRKPLYGFGDPKARLLVVGLAPAANGGTRTGRLFCGDSSGDWLIRALYETGFANQPTSKSRDDGLELKDAYLSAIVRCAPPENKPTPSEISNCLTYLCQELVILDNVRAVLVLGQIAFKGYLEALKVEYGFEQIPKPKFVHGEKIELDVELPKLFVSYHPSRRNTQTGLLSWSMWIKQFKRIRKELDPGLL